MEKQAVQHAGVKQKKIRAQNTRNMYAICFALGIGIIALYGGLWLYGRLFADKVLYGVTLSGESYGGMSALAVTQALQQRAETNEQLPLAVSKSQQTATLQSLGVEFDVATTARLLLQAGKEHDSWEIWDIVQSVMEMPEIEWQLLSDSTTEGRLALLDTIVLTDPKDAYWKLVENELIIVPEEAGRRIDVEATLTSLRREFASGKPQVLSVQSASVAPKRVAAHLAAMTSRAAQLIHQDVILTAQKGRFTVPTEELLTWLDVQDQVLVLNEGAVIQSLDARARNVERSPKVRQISATDQSVLVPGQEGITLDRERSVDAITEGWFALTSPQDQPLSVALVTKTVAPAEQVVNPTQPSTPGLYAGKYIEVDLSTQTLFQFEGQQLIGTHRVSTGKWSMPTPIGTFAINNKAPRAYSAAYGLYMPQWMAFLGSKYGLHSLPEWPDGRREGENHLGVAVSHGCVRLGREASVLVYNWAEVGTPVVIHR